MKNNKIISILLILTIIFAIAGGTLAYFTWRGSNTTVTFTVSAGFSCSVDGGGNITSSNVMLAPSTCTNSTYAIKREVKVMPSVSTGKVYLDLWINVDKLDTGLANSQNFKYVLSTSSTSCDEGVVASGSFTGKSAGVDVPLLESKVYTATTTDKYYLYVWLDKEETSTETMNQTFSLSLGGECTNHISTGADMLINKANTSTLSYSDATAAQKGEMWTFSHDATSQTEALTDYRYIGSSPNNYITFNNETWRIIGVFDGRIKIIRDTSLGSMSWDYKQSGVGSSTEGYGSNDWTDSQLMYALNNNFLGTDSTILKTGYTYDGTYVYDSSNNIIYQNGCKPASIATGATTYSCTSLGWTLNSTALNQIDKVTYYLGGKNSSNYSASETYNFERGTTVYSGRPTSWSGYVGLMYASDYGYTFANGVDDTCYNNLYYCDSGTPSWLYNWACQWLLVPNSSYSNRAFYVDSSGYVHYSDGRRHVYDSFGVRGVVYLKSDIRLKGSGTSSDPYLIAS